MGHAVNGLLFHSWQSCLCQIRRINSSSRDIVMAVLYHPKSLSRPDPLIQIQRHMEIMQSIGHFDGICTCRRGPLSRCRFDFACTITSIPQMAPRLQSSWIFGGRHRQSSQASCLSRSPDTQILQSIISNYTQAPSALGKRTEYFCRTSSRTPLGETSVIGGWCVDHWSDIDFMRWNLT